MQNQKSQTKTTQPLRFSALINPTHQDAIKYRDKQFISKFNRRT